MYLKFQCVKNYQFVILHHANERIEHKLAELVFQETWFCQDEKFSIMIWYLREFGGLSYMYLSFICIRYIFWDASFLVIIIHPASTKLIGGILVSPCPSVRPSVQPSHCPFVDRIMSTLYLQQYSPNPFHIYTSYQTTSEGVLHTKYFFFFQNSKFWSFG